MAAVVIHEEEWGSCPLCHERKTEVLYSEERSPEGLRLLRCGTCELVRTWPQRAGLSHPLEKIETYYGSDENKFMPLVQKVRNSIARMRARRYLRWVAGPERTPRILDVGCAEGRLLLPFLAWGWECWGVEHPLYPAKRFMERNRIVYLQGDLEELDLPEKSFDLIFLWHVLEHMDDLVRTLRRLCRSMTPEGSLIIAVPNFGSLEARRFKKSWFHIDAPWHRYHFNEKSMEYLVSTNGLKICSLNTLCLEQGPYGCIQSTLNALGWPRNELYEALKGKRGHHRNGQLLIQSLLAGFLAVPTLLFTFLAAQRGAGSVMKLVLRKERE